MQESFNRLLEQYHFLDEQIKRQTDLLRELSETYLYRERVEILATIPGIGMIAAMELLLELQDIKRFQRADQLAAYVGLTPSQYTSADKVRMGRITCVGKNSLRAMLIQATWILIRKDGVMREKYNRLKSRSGGKRAIVAVARTLLIRMRRLLLDNNPYVVGLVATD
jgi:transposase